MLLHSSSRLSLIISHVTFGFLEISDILHEYIEIQNTYGKKLVDFKQGLYNSNKIDEL